MTKRTLHERIGIDKTLPESERVVPDAYDTSVLDSGPDRYSSLETALDYLSREYNIMAFDGYWDHEADGLVLGEAGGGFDPAAERWTLADWQVLVNPAWLSDGVSEPPAAKGDPIWHVAKERYTPAGPDAIWEPLFDVLDERGIDAFGQIRLSRFGGDQHMDLFFPEHTIDADGVELTLGLSTEHDYFGSTAQKVEVVALDLLEGVDTDRVVVIRDIAEPITRKHTGDAPDEVAAWWRAVLDQIDDVTDRLYQTVADAMAYEIPIGSLPCTIPEFYAALGLPDSARAPIATVAAENAVGTLRGPITAYHLYRSGMEAIDERYDGRNTGAYVDRMKTINKLLFNPAGAERDALNALRSEIDELQTKLVTGDADGVDADWGELETMGEALDERQDTIADGVEMFRTAREKLRTMLDDDPTEDVEAGA